MPMPCSGADSRSLLPSLAAGPPPVVTPPHADSRTRTERQAGRQVATHSCREAQERAGGRARCQDDARKVREVAWSRKSLGPPARLAAQPLPPPGVVAVAGRGVRIPSGDRHTWGPSSLQNTGRQWGQEFGASGHQSKSWVMPAVQVVLCRPFPGDHLASSLPWSRVGQLWSLRYSKRRGQKGPRLPKPIAGQGPASPSTAGPHTLCPHFCFLSSSASRAGSSWTEAAGSLACVLVRAPVSSGQWVPVRGEGWAKATTPHRVPPPSGWVVALCPNGPPCF